MASLSVRASDRVPSGGGGGSGNSSGGGLRWDPSSGIKAYTTLMVTSLDEIDSARQTWRGDFELESRFVCSVQFFLDTAMYEAVVDDKGTPLTRNQVAAAFVARGDAANAAANAAATAARSAPGSPTPAGLPVRDSMPHMPCFRDWQRPDGPAWERVGSWQYRFALHVVDFLNSEKILGAEDMEVWGQVELLPVPVGLGPAPPPGERVCKVRIVQRIHTSFSQLFDFQSFPLDRQALTLVLQMRSPVWRFAGEDELQQCALFQTERDKEGCFSHFKRPSACISPILSAWEVFKTIEVAVGLSSGDDSRGKHVYSRAVFKITVARKWHHYAWQVVMPFMLLTLAVFAAVAPVSPEHVGERQLNTVALLFSSVGLRYILRDFLPDATSDTLLEYFVGFSLLFFLVSAVGVGLVYKFPTDSSAKKDSDEAFRQGDLIFWLVLAGLWLVGHLVFLWRARAAWAVQQKPVKPLGTLDKGEHKLVPIHNMGGVGKGSLL